jgi:hypothetical protein
MYTTHTDSPTAPDKSDIVNILYTSIPSYVTSDHVRALHISVGCDASLLSLMCCFVGRNRWFPSFSFQHPAPLCHQFLQRLNHCRALPVFAYLRRICQPLTLLQPSRNTQVARWTASLAIRGGSSSLSVRAPPQSVSLISFVSMRVGGGSGGGGGHRAQTAVRRSWILREAVTWSGKFGFIEDLLVFFGYWSFVHEHHRLYSGPRIIKSGLCIMYNLLWDM